mgnify:CR=1 FL=1|jgi:hypothetical protein|tara:strand:- start:459 stop:800 length:342 start_codon:yes stop_codon:yes gene_type:complete
MSNSSEIKFRGKQADGKNGMEASFDLETGHGYFQQDVSKFIDQAKLDREKQEYFGIKKGGYRKLATIPDVIALKIFEDHNLDLHSQEFMSDPNNLKKLKTILHMEYRSLLVNN